MKGWPERATQGVPGTDVLSTVSNKAVVTHCTILSKGNGPGPPIRQVPGTGPCPFSNEVSYLRVTERTLLGALLLFSSYHRITPSSRIALCRSSVVPCTNTVVLVIAPANVHLDKVQRPCILKWESAPARRLSCEKSLVWSSPSRRHCSASLVAVLHPRRGSPSPDRHFGFLGWPEEEPVVVLVLAILQSDVQVAACSPSTGALISPGQSKATNNIGTSSEGSRRSVS